MGLYLLLDGRTGEPQALIDGPRLTQWRTACASALAASYLAREDAARLLVIGAGAIARFLAKRAFGGAADPAKSAIWNRTPANAEAAAEALRKAASTPQLAADLDAALADGRHRLVRDHLRRAAGQGRAAEAGRACRPRRRLHAAHARGR